MAAQLTVPQILAKAADILTAQGWTRQGVYEATPGLAPEDSPLDLGSAIAKAAGIDIHSIDATTPNGIHASAVLTLFEDVFNEMAEPRSPWWALSALVDWQDEDGRTVEQVITALRAAAGIETPKPVPSPVQELAAAIIGALDLPRAEIGSDVRRYLAMRDRVACVLGNMERLVDTGDQHVFRHVLARLAEFPNDAPVTYPTRDEQAGGAL